jgi:hypothetical protein
VDDFDYPQVSKLTSAEREMPKRDRSIELTPTFRRAFLGSGLAAGGAAALGGLSLAASRGAGNPANQLPNIPGWLRYLGDGVAARTYGKPSKREAHVIRRHVEWLAASRENSVNCTPVHALDGIAEADPIDYQLIIHGLVDIRPDGQGLPVGRDTVKNSAALYMERCAGRYGEFEESAGRRPILSGGAGTPASQIDWFVLATGSVITMPPLRYGALVHGIPNGQAPVLPTPVHSGNLSLNKPVNLVDIGLRLIVDRRPQPGLASAREVLWPCFRGKSTRRSASECRRERLDQSLGRRSAARNYCQHQELSSGLPSIPEDRCRAS